MYQEPMPTTPPHNHPSLLLGVLSMRVHWTTDPPGEANAVQNKKIAVSRDMDKLRDYQPRNRRGNERGHHRQSHLW